MEQTLETNATWLLDGITGLIKRYEAQWQKTGEKYNIFRVARIAHDEVIMCRVLADLMNPKGAHGRGGLYLKLFWETIASKLPCCPELKVEHTRVATEYVIDESRRIDIVLEDGNVFVPIEVKIEAGDQQKQIADYFTFARTKNRNSHVPVLYLTVDGHEPADFSKADLGKDDYVRLSFRDDILAWLDACVRENENKLETTIPVRENIRQLIAAVKSLCDKSEDAEMEDAIFKLITKDDDSIRAALAIRRVTDFRKQVLKTFTDTVLVLVKASFSKAIVANDSSFDWYYIEIPIREDKYLLQVNYNWTSAWLCASDSCKTDSASPEWTNLNKRMKELFQFEGESVPKERLVWRGEDISWPLLDSYVNNNERDLYLAHFSEVSPQEVADKIISIARALEAVEAGK
jgi:hypothetical protein